MKPINVISLFDGISCGKLALERAGIPIKKYFASEVDPYALKVSKINHPDIIHMGDVQWISGNRFSDMDIDLLMGGSPCQGFSFAGKQLNFKDPRSALFFEFVRLLREVKPKYFLLENVMMKQEYQDVITKYLGVESIEINSSLVSAQNRRRLYWTNIPGITQPEDEQIYLKDIILNGMVDRSKSHCIAASVGRTTSREYWKKNQGGLVLTGRVVGRRINKNGTRDDYNLNLPIKQRFECRTDNKSNALTTIEKDNYLLEFEKLIHSEKALAYMNRTVKDGRNHWDFAHFSDVQNPKSAAVVANFFKGVPYNVLKDWDCIRKFHPIECERLQTIPNNYTASVSNTQRYKLIGNAWTVDVIAHILSHIPNQ